MRFVLLIAVMPFIASAGEIFTRDGVTDGDTFYLAPHAMSDSDPVLQAWVTFSLMRSTCKLEMGGANPARNSSFECEFKARRHLVSSWEEKRGPDDTDGYLDALSHVEISGFLAEYTVYYHGQNHWTLPDGLRADEFKRWRRDNLRGHKPQTRVIGSWNYRKAEPM